MDELVMTQGIYEIRNVINGKRYIGSSGNVEERVRKHLEALRRGNHHSPILQRAWKKYGEVSFEYSVVEAVEDIIFLLAREQMWLNRCAPEYNGSKSACGPVPYGSKLPPAWAAKVRATQARNRIGRPHPLKGRKLSAEHAEKSRQALEAFRAAGGCGAKGHIASDDLRQTRAANARRLWADPEYRAKSVAAREGGASNKGYKCTPEQVENRRRAARISNMKRNYGGAWQQEYERRYGDLP